MRMQIDARLACVKRQSAFLYRGRNDSYSGSTLHPRETACIVYFQKRRAIFMDGGALCCVQTFPYP